LSYKPIRQRSEVQIQENLMKYIWMKRYKNDKFIRFLDILRRFRYDDDPYYDENIMNEINNIDETNNLGNDSDDNSDND
jgi:hypothetical protein